MKKRTGKGKNVGGRTILHPDNFAPVNFVTLPYRKVYFLDNKREFSGIRIAESKGFSVF